MRTGWGASGGWRVGAETLSPVMFTRVSAMSLGKVAGEAGDYGFPPEVGSNIAPSGLYTFDLEV